MLSEQVHLLAIQASIKPETYRTPQAFRERVLALTQNAVQGLDKSPKVVAFPEAFAMPLLFWLQTPEAVMWAPSSLQAALYLLRHGWRQAMQQRVWWPSVFFHWRGAQVWPLYQAVFQEAAQASGAYVLAGSIFAAPQDHEPSRRWHSYGPAQNLSLLVSPQGTVLSRIPKVNLTHHEKASFLRGGPVGAQWVNTQIGTLATLICLDAFHDRLVERCDAAGAWLLMQPSANAARWDGPWGSDPNQIEGEVWLREGLAHKLQRRENLRYGLNPMLVGRFYELAFEGRSGVYAAGKALALAANPTQEDVVHHSVLLPWLRV